MKRIYLIISVLVSFAFSWLTMNSIGIAGIPVWSFTPNPSYPPAISITTTETQTIKYIVTNHSRRSHVLQMRAINGITASGCTTALGHNKSCVLSLAVVGKALSGNVIGGPILCDRGNPNQCYRPSEGDELTITLIPANVFTVTAEGDENVTPIPSSQSVSYDQVGTIDLDISPGYTASIADDTCDGSLAGTTYTTGAVTANCSVSFSSTPE